MGSLFGFNVPTPPPPPPAAMPPTLASPQTGAAGAIQAEKARMAGGLGFSDTIKNTGGPAGLIVPAKNKAVKSLLS